MKVAGIRGAFNLIEWNVTDEYYEMIFRHSLPYKRMFKAKSPRNSRRKNQLWTTDSKAAKCTCLRRTVKTFNVRNDEVDAVVSRNINWFNGNEVGCFIWLEVGKPAIAELGYVGGINLNRVEVVEGNSEIYFTGSYASQEFIRSLKIAWRALMNVLKLTAPIIKTHASSSQRVVREFPPPFTQFSCDSQ